MMTLAIVTFKFCATKKRIALIVRFGAMRVDADLHGVDTKAANQRRLFFLDQDRVGLELHIEGQLARAPYDRKYILAQHRLAAADSQQKYTRIGHLYEQAFDFVVAQFALIVVIEVAMDASLVATPGDVEMNAERDTELDRLGVDVFENCGHPASGPIG